MGYRAMKKMGIYISVLLLTGIQANARQKGKVTVVQQAGATSRIQFGAQRLMEVLKNTGHTVSQAGKTDHRTAEHMIVIGELQSELLRDTFINWDMTTEASKSSLQKEGYIIFSSGNKIYVGGAGPSGVLYGCLELSRRIKAEGTIPRTISLIDQPEMVMRGTCIGLQKPYYLPGRTVYEYPYTPQTFPWFYDKKLWIQYLDSLVENRMNSLYLWNGHPFASLVKLEAYPYAVEVDEATFKKNEEIYRFITTEADRRGIWVIQMFYNIIVSKPFAQKHNIKTQERERPIIPLIADYTRKSIAAFVQKYPNVGLMVCLGEAMEGNGPDDIEWFTKTIIPGVQDGLKALGKTEEPPIVLRAHDTDAPSVMKAALSIYKNLYTEAKFNGEALTYARPRGRWAELHQTLSRLGGVQIENVHILANLEPFRYGSVDFIQQSVIGMHEQMNGNGLHLYPQASYWDWPYSADSVKGKRLLQVERDWIWYKAWARYAWKAKRDRSEEVNYWSNLLAAKYGCSKEQGKKILDAYEQSGEIAPKLLRRFGITDGNRQTLTLGMLMTQLINPYRYGLFTLMYESESPEGEMLNEYAQKEWSGEKHLGETPAQIIAEVRQHGKTAVAAIEMAAAGITKNKDEFERLKNDMYCYKALADHYASKTEAALHIIRYKFSGNVKDLQDAYPILQQSVASYRELVSLTKGTYLYANSMQTQQRKIPMRGVNGTFKTWAEMVAPFDNELTVFKTKIDSLLHPVQDKAHVERRLLNAGVQIDNASAQWFTMDSASTVFSDTSLYIIARTNMLRGVRALKLSAMQQMEEGTTLTFTNDKPVKVLVGYFVPQRAAFAKITAYAKAPELETNASANNYGQAEIIIANAIVIKGMPPINIHTYSFNAGTNTLKLPKGMLLIAGFVPAQYSIPVYDAGLTENGISKNIDWLFE
jgi:hypothetical protein